MASELKTVPTRASVVDFLNGVTDEKRRQDSLAVLELMREVTGEEPVMWGSSIVGFGNCHYRYESGREGDMPIAGFSPRKAALTLYIMSGFSEYEDLIQKLGKHTTGKACLYIRRLSDVNMDVLRELVSHSVAFMRARTC
jgi:hypothetical protein